jgi:hypothetical protein
MSILLTIRYSFRWLFHPQFIAGERAERHFEALCAAQGYILERISQDRKSFGTYALNTQKRVKRGDYIVRNLKNAEVEVKCYTGRKYRSAKCFVIEYSQIKRHEEMERLIGEPVIFAIFERNGRDVVQNSLRMIPLRELTPPSRRHRAVFYDKAIKCLCIPLDVMYPAFEYFEKYKSCITRPTSPEPIFFGRNSFPGR